MRILHALSQRPLLTGSGITLDALVRRSAAANHEQRVVVGVPADVGPVRVGGLEAARVHPLRFETPKLPFPVPGMSDVMPYKSTRWSAMTERQLNRYRESWLEHLRTTAGSFEPDVVHVHHLWILGGLIRDVFPNARIVNHCHGTGLRQMTLCPHLAEDVTRRLRKNDAVLALHGEQQAEIAKVLSIPLQHIHVVGAGYKDELFGVRPRQPAPVTRIVYVGKYSRAKGLPWLLDAVESLASKRSFELHVAGTGAGGEADQLRARMEAMEGVVLHGQISQQALADLLATARVFILPSMYEGLPLVIIEAIASGCRVVATSLPGVERELAPHLDDAISLVSPPRRENRDQPLREDLPSFVESLQGALLAALDAPEVTVASDRLERFTWNAVFQRVQRVWMGQA